MATTGKHHHHNDSRHFKVPDGGFGWFVVVAMFLVFMIVAGGFFSFGVLYVALLDAFGGSQAETAWVGSLVLMVTVSTNPFSAYLAERFGYRPIAMVGGVVASIALLISSFTTSLAQLYLTYGVLLGIGYSFVHLPSFVMVGRYFRKKLSIAMGIALAGTGIGQCAMAFIIQMLKEAYGWRGTFMIMSGVTLNLCVAAALLRPLKVTKKKRKKRAKRSNEDVFIDDIDITEVGQHSNDKTVGLINANNYYRNTKNTHRLGDAEITVIDRSHKIDNMIYSNNYNFNGTSNKHYSPLSSGDDVWRHHSQSSFESSSESSDDEEEERYAQSTLLAMAELSFGSGLLWMSPTAESSTESESDSDNEEKYSPELEIIEEKKPDVIDETPINKEKRCSFQGGFEKFKSGLRKCLAVLRKGLKMWNKVMDFSLWKEPVFVVIQVSFLCHYCGHSIVTSHLDKL